MTRDVNGLGALFDPQIEEEARSIITNARREDYGDADESFARIANVWTGIIGKKVSPREVAMCMVGLKLVREANKPKRDNRVDAIGYVLLLDDMEE